MLSFATLVEHRFISGAAYRSNPYQKSAAIRSWAFDAMWRIRLALAISILSE